MNWNAATSGRRALLILAGGASMALGGLALIGWVFQIPALTRSGTSFDPMVANAAAGFLVDGLALILISAWRSRAAMACAALSLLVAVLTLAEYGLPVALGIDQVLAVDTILLRSAHPGRMAPNAALCFVLCSLALWLASRHRQSGKTATITGVLGAVALSIGAASVLGYLAGYPTYAWGHWVQMSANASFGFIALG